MNDIVDSLTRSRMMSAIKGRNTSPELIVRSYLHACGLRFRIHDRTLPGRPDLVLTRYRAAIFVHGCFWHRHAACRFATTPRTRAAFWKNKFDSNVLRDQRDRASLEALGWTVLTVWECESRQIDTLDELFWKVVAAGTA